MAGIRSHITSAARHFRHLGRLCSGRQQRGALQIPHRFAAPRTSRDKADPFGFCTRSRRAPHPSFGISTTSGTTTTGCRSARPQDSLRAPHSIYEVHLGSWMRVPEEHNRPLTYRETAPRLAEYVDQHGLHPRRIPARDGASVLRLLGISDHGLLRAHLALRHAAGFHVPGRLPAPARHRRDSRLGPVALPFRRARPRLLRRHASLTSTPTRARDSIPTGRRTSSTTAAPKSAAS